MWCRRLRHRTNRAGSLRKTPEECWARRSRLQKLADGVRLARTEQTKLHAETTRIEPAHDAGQPSVGFGIRQAQQNGNLLTEAHLCVRHDEYATDADVPGVSLDGFRALHLARDGRAEGDSGMTTLVLHGASGAGE